MPIKLPERAAPQTPEMQIPERQPDDVADPSGVPQVDLEGIPDQARYLLFDPEIGGVLHNAVTEGWNGDQVAEALRSTGAFTEVQDRRRVVGDPTNGSQARSDLALQVGQMLARPADDPQVAGYVNQLASGQLTMAGLRTLVAPIEQGTSTSRVIELAARHGVPMSEASAQGWTAFDEATIDQQLGALSQGLYPYKPQGLPFSQFASAFADLHHAELGQQVQPSDPRFQQLLEQSGGQLGAYRALVRQLPEWEQTPQAQQLIADRTNQLTQALLSGDSFSEEMARNRASYEQQVATQLGAGLQPLVQPSSSFGGPQAMPVSDKAAGSVIQAAQRYLGTPYRWGGTDPRTGLDCSGYVQLVYSNLGVKLPRTAAEQARVGARVSSLADARPGDLIFFSGSTDHIGIYAGNGLYYNAPHTGDVVKLAPVTRRPTTIRRIL